MLRLLCKLHSTYRLHKKNASYAEMNGLIELNVYVGAYIRFGEITIYAAGPYRARVTFWL